MAGSRKVTGSPAVVGHNWTAPGSTKVRACTAIELSHTGSADLDDDYFSTDADGHYGVLAPEIRRA